VPAVRTLDDLLKDAFDSRHVDRTVGHFNAMISTFQQGGWEQSITKGGKFVEAALKALSILVGLPVPASARDFKADKAINDLSQVPKGSFSDAIRLTIPRACRFAYDIASNRGARHDPGEVDPNEMDANVVVATCSWILAEMLRESQKGALDNAAASNLVRSLTEKRYPFVEEVDGRVYFHVDAISARDAAILTLWHGHPKRRTRQELIASITRHGHTRSNAQEAISRLGGLVDGDEHGALRLLQPGLKRADQLIGSMES
jgi:hypothetical protein